MYKYLFVIWRHYHTFYYSVPDDDWKAAKQSIETLIKASAKAKTIFREIKIRRKKSGYFYV